jgi:2-hydroxychromene-2-carboxylate isomerase
MSGMVEVEFWYDIVCPYAYLGSTQVERVAREAGATVRWEPFLLGGLFRALDVPTNLAASISEAKRRYNARDLERWADWLGVPLRVPPEHPRRTVLALRALLAAGEAGRVAATHALYRAYWVQGRDVADPSVVRAVFDEAGLDGEACVARASRPEIKDELHRRTRRAVERGVFGAPTFFVGDAMFWGQDRLNFVARALRAARVTEGARSD